MVEAGKTKRKLAYMGESDANKTMLKIDSSLMGIYRILPFTYFGMLRRAFGDFLKAKRKIAVLDLGCGDGSATQNLALPKNFEIVGVDVFQPYLRIARMRGIYKRLIKHDVANYKPKRKYDIVISLHVLEHFSKSKGEKYLEQIEVIAKKRIIVASPIGDFPQQEYDDNPHQVHRSSWFPNEMKQKGFRIYAQGLRFLWGNENVVVKYGVLSYFLFLVSILLSPLLWFRPDLGTYMICVKEVARVR